MRYDTASPATLRGTALRALAIFALEAAVLGSLVLRHSRVADLDSLFHAKMAWLLWHEGLRRDFPWMTCSITAAHWADHHFLFHVLLAPLSPLGLDVTLRLGAVLLGALGLTACVLSLARAGVRHLWFWALALPLCSDVFLFRMAMTRAMPLCLALTVLHLDALEARRARRAGVIGFVSMWAYQGGIFLLPLAALHALRDRLRALPRAGTLLATLAGLVLGLTLNPFFPATWDFLALHIGPYLSHDPVRSLVDVGLEWRPADLSLVPRVVPVLALGFVLPLVGIVRRRWSAHDDALAAAVLLFALASLRAQRFLEYLAPLSVMLGARVWTRGALDGLLRPSLQRAATALATAATLAYGAAQWRSIHRDGFSVEPRDVEGAARWLARNTPRDAVVFHAAWDDFAPLFYFNHHNRYLFGLDPYWFVEHDPALYVRYRLVTEGRDPDPVDTIRTRFHSRHIALVARPGLLGLAQQLRRDPRARLVFQSPRTLVFALDE